MYGEILSSRPKHDRWYWYTDSLAPHQVHCFFCSYCSVTHYYCINFASNDFWSGCNIKLQIIKLHSESKPVINKLLRTVHPSRRLFYLCNKSTVTVQYCIGEIRHHNLIVHACFIFPSLWIGESNGYIDRKFFIHWWSSQAIITNWWAC